MTARHALYVLLAAVSLAAAVLSFSALRDLASLCGFSTRLAPLLPVVVDAGAAAGSLVWLGRHGDARAQKFATWLALVLLASSVAANAVSHGLEAYGMRPAWWVVVVVSAVAPGVLGAVVHLAVLVGRAATPPPLSTPAPVDVATATPAVANGGGEVAEPERQHVFVALDRVAAFTRPPQFPQLTTLSTTSLAAVESTASDVEGQAGGQEEPWEVKRDRLLGEGAGRKRLSKELNVSEWEARRMQERWEAQVESVEESGEEAAG